jgi:hypothetical protein
MKGKKERQDKGLGQSGPKLLSAHRFFWAAIFRSGPAIGLKPMYLLVKWWAKGPKWPILTILGGFERS